MSSNNTTGIYIDLLENLYGDDTAAYVLHALYICIGVWCVTTNCFLFIVLFKHEVLHTTANIFVANIALSDTFVGLSQLIVRPLTISAHVSVDFAQSACLVFTFCVLFTHVAAVQALCLATWERYVKICHPYKYERIMKTAYIAPLLITTWVISILYGCMITDSHWSPETTCKLASIIGTSSLRACLPYVSLVIILLCVFNFRIFSIVSKHRRQIEELSHQLPEPEHEHRTEHIQRAKLIGVVVLFTCICYIPYTISLIVGVVLKESSSVYRIIDNVTIAILYINNMVNPLIFGWKDRNIRKYAKQFLGFK